MTMAHLITFLLWAIPVAAVFGIIYSDKRIYDAVDAILNRIFEKF